MTEPDTPLHRDNWPRSIALPGEYDGGEVVVIDWEDVFIKERKQAIAAWVEALPTMKNARHLNIWARVPQDVFYKAKVDKHVAQWEAVRAATMGS